MNYYRRYVGDYLRDTADLSLAEHGAYCLLLDYYYAEERPLPLEKRSLYRKVRAMDAAEQRSVDTVLERFFHLADDGYRHKRVDHEIAVSQQARANGGKGGRPRSDETGYETGPETGCETGCETEGGTGFDSEDATGSGHPPTTTLQPPATNPQPPGEASEGSLRSPSVSPAAPTTVEDAATLTLTPPEARVNGKGRHIPDCPHDRIIDLFKQHFPALRHPVQWTGSREANLRARWREAAKGGLAWSRKGFTTEDEGIAHFGRVFSWMAESEKLRRGIPRRNNDGYWRMDLPWLVKQENWVKVIEGAFHGD